LVWNGLFNVRVHDTVNETVVKILTQLGHSRL